MITQVLNKSEVEKLFKKEAVFISGDNVIPVLRAEILFGKEAVEFAEQKPGQDYNEFWLGPEGCRIRYLYYSGFKKAVTYCNIMNILVANGPVEVEREEKNIA